VITRKKPGVALERADAQGGFSVGHPRGTRSDDEDAMGGGSCFAIYVYGVFIP
jgi:hypothetical protein